MTDRPAKPVLLTGASGKLGRALTKWLAAEGWTLRLTDIEPFPDAIPPGASFTKADLSDGVTILRLAEGCGAIVHLGGVSVERPFEEIIGNLALLTIGTTVAATLLSMPLIATSERFVASALLTLGTASAASP